MSKKIIINYYEEKISGIGYYEVPRSILKEFNLENEISSYSYQKGDMIYLEEDIDAPFVTTIIRHKGYDIIYKEHYTDRSEIRNYQFYKKYV